MLPTKISCFTVHMYMYFCFVCLLMAGFLWFLWMNNSIIPSSLSPSPHSMLLQMLRRWYWVTNVILMMLGLSAQREGNWWDCPAVCEMISRHAYMYLYEYLSVHTCTSLLMVCACAGYSVWGGGKLHLHINLTCVCPIKGCSAKMWLFWAFSLKLQTCF